jgi:hypothetical protein
MAVGSTLLLRPTVVALVTLAALVVPSTAGARSPTASASALHHVTPGHSVLSYHVHGFPSHDRLTVSLTPNPDAHSNCCGYLVHSRYYTDDSGRALIRFKFPRFYYSGCDGANHHCSRHRWRHHSVVLVFIADSDGNYTTARVRIR